MLGDVTECGIHNWSYALKLIRIYTQKTAKDEAASVCIFFFAKFLKKVDGRKG